MLSIVVFAYFFLLGIVSGLLYDLFKLLRNFIGNIFMVYFIDIAYFTVCSIITFIASVYVNSGTIRAFMFQGEGFGFMLYRFAVRKIFLRFFKR